MSFLTYIVFRIAYYTATIGYPAYQVYLLNKESKMDRLWILYFFIFGLFTVLEGTLLFPVKAFCGWSWVKLILAVWLQHPTYRGALFLEQIVGPKLDMAYDKIAPFATKALSFIGVPDRSAFAPEQSTKKSE